MVAKSKLNDTAGFTPSDDQFVFVEVPAPSNDNRAGMLTAGPLLSDLDAPLSSDVLFTVGDIILGLDDDPSAALLVALDGADSQAAEYEAFSASVMFVFGDAVAGC